MQVVVEKAGTHTSEKKGVLILGEENRLNKNGSVGKFIFNILPTYFISSL